MNRIRLLVLNAALGPLDYRVPYGMEAGLGSVVVAPLGPRKLGGVRSLQARAERCAAPPVGCARARQRLTKAAIAIASSGCQASRWTWSSTVARRWAGWSIAPSRQAAKENTP